MMDDVETPAPTRNDKRAAMPDWQRNLLTGLCGLVAIFALGAMAGYTSASLEYGFGGIDFAVLAGLLALGGAAGWFGWKLYTARNGEPEANRVRVSRKILWIAGVLGGVMGLMLSISTDIVGSGSLFSNSAMPATAAIIAIIAWIFGGMGLTFVWLRTIDEHEMRANNAGALAGLCTYLAVEPSWWLGWRGGFLPEPQPMMTFLLVLFVYSAVWFWRRNH